MADAQDEHPWKGNLEAFIVLSAAVVLAALLQLVVFLPPGSTSWHWTLGVILGGYMVVAFIYLGGWERVSGQYSEWSIRRHIRKHHGLVDDLLSLLEEHGQVFGSGAWFLSTGNSIMSNYVTVGNQNPPVFTPQQRESGNQAHATLYAWSNASAYWSHIKGTLEWRIRHRAYLDSYEFYWAAKMVGVEISRGIMSASNFVNSLRGAGVEHLPNYNADRWDEFRGRADSVVRLAKEIDRKAKRDLGMDVGLNLPFVPQLYPRAGEGAPTPAPKMGEINSPSEPALESPPPTPTTSVGTAARTTQKH